MGETKDAEKHKHEEKQQKDEEDLVLEPQENQERPKREESVTHAQKTNLQPLSDDDAIFDVPLDDEDEARQIEKGKQDQATYDEDAEEKEEEEKENGQVNKTD